MLDWEFSVFSKRYYLKRTLGSMEKSEKIGKCFSDLIAYEQVKDVLGLGFWSKIRTP